MTTLSRHHLTGLAALAAASAALALPSAASAYGGTAYVAADGHVAFDDDDDANYIKLDYYGSSRMIILGYGVKPGAGCRPYSEFYDKGADCPVSDDGTSVVELNLNGGNDDVFPRRTIYDVDIDFGAGNDSYDGRNVDAVVHGGPGDDHLAGGNGIDELHGGEGSDFVHGRGSSDRLFGDGGDDAMIGDGRDGHDTDVIDGGAGHDELDDYIQPSYHHQALTANVSFDGVANDGFDGENDSIAGIEELNFYAATNFVGSGGDDMASAQYETETIADGPSRLQGLGGDDTLTGGDHADTIEGGEGGDRLTGGTGPDRIDGGGGGDAVEARDGVADTVTCGPGTDSVVADANDAVAADCETVARPPVAPDGGGGSGGSGSGTRPGPGAGQAGGGATPGTAPAPGLALAGRPKLRTALRRGLTVRVPATAGDKVTVRARSGGKVVARGTAKAASSGVAQVKLRFTAAARKRLRSARSVRLTLEGAGKALTVRLAR